MEKEGNSYGSNKNFWNFNDFALAFFFGIFFFAISMLLLILLELTLPMALILVAIMVSIYAVILFFLIGPRKFRQMEQMIVHHTVQSPVIKEVVVEKPVIKEVQVIRNIEVPVPVDRIVEKKVYIEKKRKKLDIPKYEFIGSMETKTYHKRNCRLGKLIKKKYKISNNSEQFFIKRKFDKCKVCITKEKKI